MKKRSFFSLLTLQLVLSHREVLTFCSPFLLQYLCAESPRVVAFWTRSPLNQALNKQKKVPHSPTLSWLLCAGGHWKFSSNPTLQRLLLKMLGQGLDGLTSTLGSPCPMGRSSHFHQTMDAVSWDGTEDPCLSCLFLLCCFLFVKNIIYSIQPLLRACLGLQGKKKSSIFLTRIFSVDAFLQAHLVEIKFFSWPAERAVSTQQACGQFPAGTVCQELLQLKTNHPTAAQR